MASLIIGDFRSIPLQHCQNRSSNITLDYTYLTEAAADLSWFKTTAVAQLPLMAFDKANVIIMLGFNDCVYSCVWNSFKISTLATDYANIINELIEQYPSINFYISSVTPIDSDYPFIAYKGGIIPKVALTEKIKQFNTDIKSKCKAAYIDCYTYLKNTSFSTRDGVRYTHDTCDNLLSFIKCNLKPTAGNQFISRQIEPTVNQNDVESDIYWLSSTITNGLNPFAAKSNGSVLPNNAAYAWGRFYEINDDKPTLNTTVSTWYANTADGYKRGAEPMLGAIACWKNTAGSTVFVAVVEQINEDGSIITSESTSTKAWQLTERKNNSNWGESTYTFQGFIYCPAVTPTASLTAADKSTVIVKAEALSRSEMEANAKYIWNYLGSKGWSLNAVAGMLGNMQAESTINPGRHQVGSGENGGFGLVQWTPKKNVTEWLSANGYADDDMDGQLERIIYEKENGKQYDQNKYKYTFETFSTSLDDPYTLACAFAFDYERSWVTLYGTEAKKEVLRQERGKAAEEWYSFLTPFAPTQPAEEKFILDSFSLDYIGTTKVKASFVTRNGLDGKYVLCDANGKQLAKNAVKVNSNKSELFVSTFECSQFIKPNTSYTLSIEVTSAVGECTYTKSIKFTTPAIKPTPVKSIKFTCADAIKSADSTFKLEVKMPDDIGSWKIFGAGYEKYLIVNNSIIKTKIGSTVENISDTFTIKSEFGYNCLADDNIQIGIRMLTKDANGSKAYSELIASEPICLLNQPIQVYLNK